MGIYKALEFNTTTDLIDIVTAFDPSLVYPNTVATANQNLAAGALVSLVNISGSIQVINALALSTSPAPALGFVLAATAVNTPATVYTVGNYFIHGAYTTANVGQTVYLSASLPGQATLTAPSSPNLIQPVGVIVSVDNSGNATVAWSLDQATAGIVSSVGLSMPTDFIVSNSPITSSGTLNVVWSNQGVNLVFAGPASVGTGDLYGSSAYGSGVYSGNGGPPVWRSLVVADIPNLPASIITSGTLSMTVGGTNANFSSVILGDTFYGNATGSPAVSAMVRLPGNTTAVKNFLTQTGTGTVSAAPAWGTISNSDLPTSGVTPGSYQSANITVNAQGIITAAATGFSDPMTTLGDMIYEAAPGSPPVPTPTRLAGNTTTTKQFLTQTGTGSASSAPAWGSIASGDLPVRILAKGTAQIPGNVVLSGWGLSGGSPPFPAAAVGIAGYDSAFTVTITAGGTSFSTNPTFTVAYADGAYAKAPVILCQQVGGNDVVSFVTVSASTSNAIFTWNATPAAPGATYIFNILIQGLT